MEQGFEDDSSAALGLGYSWRSAHPDDPLVASGQTNELLSDERWNDDENARLREQCERDGVPYAKPGEQIVATNAGAYESITPRIDQLLAEGYALHEATSIAREESVAVQEPSGAARCTGQDDCKCRRCNSVHAGTLKRSVPPGGHSRSGRRYGDDQKLKKRNVGRPRIEDEIVKQKTIYVTDEQNRALDRVGGRNEVIRAVAKAIIEGRPYIPPGLQPAPACDTLSSQPAFEQPVVSKVENTSETDRAAS